MGERVGFETKTNQSDSKRYEQCRMVFYLRFWTPIVQRPRVGLRAETYLARQNQKETDIMRSTLPRVLADMAWRDKQFAFTIFWPWALFALALLLLGLGVIK
jgi:hypothetical protein